MKKVILPIMLLSFLMCTTRLSAQFHSILNQFEVFQVGDKVLISCTISAGNTCRGIDLMHSEDSISFKTIDRISGVCGSLSKAVSYRFTDDSPLKNRVNYYKLNLNNRGYSQAISIEFIDTEKLGYQLRPNPTNESTTIYFENRENKKVELRLFHPSGTIMTTQESNKDFFKINLQSFESGVYSFQIAKESKNSVLSGKLIVQH